MKSRGVYETPGGAILYKAIDVLETITLDKESAHFKAQLAQKYADIVYNGQWFTPLREALDAFADSLEKTVTGDVKLKLYKGNMINAGVTSPFTLYDEQTASFGVHQGACKAVQELAGGQVISCNIFPFVCFHTFTRKFHPTGIVAGGTAAGAFSPAAALPFL